MASNSLRKYIPLFVLLLLLFGFVFLMSYYQISAPIYGAAIVNVPIADSPGYTYILNNNSFDDLGSGNIVEIKENVDYIDVIYSENNDFKVIRLAKGTGGIFQSFEDILAASPDTAEQYSVTEYLAYFLMYASSPDAYAVISQSDTVNTYINNHLYNSYNCSELKFLYAQTVLSEEDDYITVICEENNTLNDQIIVFADFNSNPVIYSHYLPSEFNSFSRADYQDNIHATFDSNNLYLSNKTDIYTIDYTASSSVFSSEIIGEDLSGSNYLGKKLISSRENSQDYLYFLSYDDGSVYFNKYNLSSSNRNKIEVQSSSFFEFGGFSLSRFDDEKILVTTPSDGFYVFDISDESLPSKLFAVNPTSNFDLKGAGSLYEDYWIGINNSGFYSVNLSEINSSNYINAQAEVVVYSSDLIDLHGENSVGILSSNSYCPSGFNNCLEKYYKWTCLNCANDIQWQFDDEATILVVNLYNSSKVYHFMLNFSEEYFSNEGDEKILSSYDCINSDGTSCDEQLIFALQNFEISLSPDKSSYSQLELISFSDTFNYTGASYNVFWKFGDGVTSTSETPSHIYTNTGTYQVNLTINATGVEPYTSSTSIVITERDSDSLQIYAVDGRDFHSCGLLAGDAVQFNHSSTLDKSTYTLNWDFDNGESITGGNGSNGTEDFPETNFDCEDDESEYNVSLEILINGQTAEKASKIFEILDPYDPSNLKFSTYPFRDIYFVNQNIEFYSSIYCEDTSSITCSSSLWNFNDSQTSTSLNSSINHSYSQVGEYNVKKTIVVGGQTYNYSKDICVVQNQNALDNPQFTISLLPDEDYYIIGDNITFSYSFSSGCIDSVLWRFGNGAISTEDSPVYSYSSKNEYVLNLTVLVGSTSFSKTKTIIILDHSPIALISGDFSDIEPPEYRVFNAEDSFDPDDDISFVIWDLGIKREPWGILNGELGSPTCAPLDEGYPCDDDYEFEGSLEDELGNPCTCTEQSAYIYPSSTKKIEKDEESIYQTVVQFYTGEDDCNFRDFTNRDYCTVSLYIEDEEGNSDTDTQRIYFSDSYSNQSFYENFTCGDRYRGSFYCLNNEEDNRLIYKNSVLSCCCQEDEKFINNSCMDSLSGASITSVICRSISCPAYCSEGEELVAVEDDPCCSYRCISKNGEDEGQIGCASSCMKGYVQKATPESECPFICVLKEEKSNLILYIIIALVLLVIIGAIVTGIVLFNKNIEEDHISFQNTTSDLSTSESGPLSQKGYYGNVREKLQAGVKILSGKIQKRKTMVQLKNYISSARAKGFSDAEIKNKLVGSGWSKKQIDNFFRK